MESVKIGNLTIPALKGEKGDTGEIVSVSVTSVNSLESANVINEGTTTEAKLVFKLPKAVGIKSTRIVGSELIFLLDNEEELNAGTLKMVTNFEVQNGTLAVNYSDGTSEMIGDLYDEEFISVRVEEYNDNATSKLNEYNSNATSKTTTFDTNASEKQTNFNTNATNKTNTFNANAISKKTDFNTNVTNKTNEFNTNATEKITEYNNNASTIQAELDEIQAEIGDISIALDIINGEVI